MAFTLWAGLSDEEHGNVFLFLNNKKKETLITTICAKFWFFSHIFSCCMEFLYMTTIDTYFLDIFLMRVFCISIPDGRRS